MIAVCHPVDDLEPLFLQPALEAPGIPHFVVGLHFGSLYPGTQVPRFNERSARVPRRYAATVLAVIEDVRSTYAPLSRG